MAPTVTCRDRLAARALLGRLTVVSAAAGLLLGLAAQTAQACDVPVFRYALENWPADPYLVIVFHKGKLTAAQHAAAVKLCPMTKDQLPLANCELADVDVTGAMSKGMRALWKAQKPTKMPWVVVRYFDPSNQRQNVWAGPLGDKALASLCTSPVRRKIARRILAGDSAVWILLESGNAKKDNQAAQLLQKDFRKVEKELQIPPDAAYEDGEGSYNYGPDGEVIPSTQPTTQPAGAATNPSVQPAPAQGPPPLKVAFSLIRVSRKDPAEHMLVRMLMTSEPGLNDPKYAHDPMAFPIFGRGRALFALVGPGINEENIIEACGFLVTGCSCQVKAMNPGTDLLMAEDWDAALQGDLVDEQNLPPLTGAPAAATLVAATQPTPATTQSASAANRPATAARTTTQPAFAGPLVPLPDAAARRRDALATEVSPPSHALWRNLLIALGAVVVVVVVLGLAIGRSSSRRSQT